MHASVCEEEDACICVHTLCSMSIGIMSSTRTVYKEEDACICVRGGGRMHLCTHTMLDVHRYYVKYSKQSA
jgi:hypothetical protein